MTAHKKEILWRHYLIKLPENGFFFKIKVCNSVFFKKEEEVIFEGELLKYKPGLNFNYVKRWCQLTPKYFRFDNIFRINQRANFN